MRRPRTVRARCRSHAHAPISSLYQQVPGAGPAARRAAPRDPILGLSASGAVSLLIPADHIAAAFTDATVNAAIIFCVLVRRYKVKAGLCGVVSRHSRRPGGAGRPDTPHGGASVRSCGVKRARTRPFPSAHGRTRHTARTRPPLPDLQFASARPRAPTSACGLLRRAATTKRLRPGPMHACHDSPIASALRVAETRYLRVLPASTAPRQRPRADGDGERRYRRARASEGERRGQHARSRADEATRGMLLMG